MGDLAQEHRGKPILGPALTLGFLASVLMWVVWFFTHLPGVGLPSAASGVLLLIVMASVLGAGGAIIGRPRALRVGLASGLVSSLVNLMVLGSFLVEQPATTAEVAPGAGGVKPSAPVIVLGFLVLGGAVGMIAAVLGSRIAPPIVSARIETAESMRRFWLSRFAIVSVLATAPVIVVGGTVTSTESGMAVPDWPGSYGANMLLYPIGLMAHPRIFLEHTHRLFGMLAGVTTIVMMVFTLVRGGSGLLKAWAIGLLALVSLQGTLGGLRVEEVSPYYGVFHGVTAQVFLALMVAFAAFVSPVFGAHASPPRGRAGVVLVALLACLLMQLTFGAMYRHLSADDPPASGASHALLSHVVFSFVVMAVAIVAGVMLMRSAPAKGAEGDSTGRKLGVGLHAVVTVQFVLGWGALGVTGMSGGSRGAPPTAEQLETAEPVPLMEAIFTTAHHANGALLVVIATLGLCFWLRSRGNDGAPAMVREPDPTPALSGGA